MKNLTKIKKNRQGVITIAQSDLHAYATLCIAKAAGYSDEDAVLLAWADLETDYTLQVKTWNCFWSNLGLEFHFWPGDPKDLICWVDSELSKLVTHHVAFNMIIEPPYKDLQKLCALGIALHGLQDTYFHQNWVGKFDKHNCLPLWAKQKNRFIWSLPFPYGHSTKGLEPDIANAVWYDPRTQQTIVNLDRVIYALRATARILGLSEIPDGVIRIFYNEPDYDMRKQNLRELAGMPDLRISKIRKEMLKKYGAAFGTAAKEQARIVKDYLNT